MKRFLLFGFLFVLITSAIVSCQKELSYETDQNVGRGTLYDSLNACQPMVPNGTYYNGVSANRDTNYVTVIVTVTQTGTYTLNTGMTNGFGFSDTGYFSKLGVDTILLRAYGTPILNVPTDFTLALDSSVCGFTINVQDSTGTGLGSGDPGVEPGGDSSFVDPNPAAANSWHFTDSIYATTYSGSFDPLAGGTFQTQDSTLIVQGTTSTSDTLFGIVIKMPTGSVATGIYPLSGDNIIGMEATEVLFYAGSTTAPAGTTPSYITITSYDANTRRIAGSFHCWAVNPDGNLTLIKGSFECLLV